MNNITKVTETGVCTGCGACGGCEHITFADNTLGFPAPIVDEGCLSCGNCLSQCPFNYENETDL